MAKTAAERQKDYRAKRPFAGDNGERRLNTWISSSAHFALDRLAASYGVTKREMIEKLVVEEDQKAIKKLGGLDSPGGEAYLASQKLRSN
jgi:hypothetical protein